MVLEATHSNTHEMNPFSIIQVYIKSPLPNKLKTECEKHRMLDSAPSWFFCPSMSVRKVKNSPSLKSEEFCVSSKFHTSTSKTTPPRLESLFHYLPDEYFWNLIYFCKTRQNWSIPQATIAACMGYIFFSFTKKLFFLGQHLIGKLRFLWVTRRQIIITYTFIASKHVSQESIQP